MKTTLFLASFALWSSSVLAQHSDWTHLYSQLQINDVVEQPACFWLATDRGLFRLDKASEQITHYDKTNSVLPDDHIQTLTADAAGSIWIGTYDLALLEVPADGSPWQVTPYPATAPGLVVYSSEADANGDIWLGTSQGLLHYDGQQWQQHAVSGTDLCDGGPIWELKINSQGVVYGASNNLLRFENGAWTELRDTGVTMNAYNDAYVCIENDTTVWYFGDASRASRYDGQTWSHWYQDEVWGTPALPAQPYFPNLSMQVAANGAVYYNSHNSLVYFDGNDWIETPLNEVPGQAIQVFRRSDDGTIWTFGQNEWTKEANGTATRQSYQDLHPFGLFSHFANDRNGNLYLSDYSRGIYQLSTGAWQQTIAVANGDTMDIHEALVFDDANEKWFISRINYHPVLVEQRGNDWQVHDAASTGLFPTSNGPADMHYFFFLAVNPSGTIWVVDETGTIFQYKNEQWSALSLINSDWFSDIASDAQGNFWWIEGQFGGAYHLKQYDGNQVHSFSLPANTLPILTKPAVDAAGNIWICTQNDRVLSFDGANWTAHHLPTGISFNALLERNGQLFGATSYDGLWRYDNGQWTNATKANSGLSYDDIRQLAFDAQGDLWCMTGSGGQVIDIWNTDLIAGSHLPASDAPEWTLFPNPATTQLTVQADLQGTERVQVLNALGQPVLRPALGAGSVASFDISMLAPGVYWLQIEESAQAFVVK